MGFNADDAGLLIFSRLRDYFGSAVPDETPVEGHPFWTWMRECHPADLDAIVHLFLARETEAMLDEKVLAGELIAERTADGRTSYRKATA